MNAGHYVAIFIFTDERHTEWLLRGFWARPSDEST